MDRQTALKMIEEYIEQYIGIPSELHRGFAIGFARFALECHLISAHEFISYCERMIEVRDNA